MVAATETSTATSLMRAPRAAWRRIAVRGPARPAAEPGVQRGGGGEGGGISTQLQTPGRAEPPARPPSWEQPPRAAKPGASLRRARRDPPSQRRSLGRGRATAPPARCPRLAGGGDGARWGTAALPSRGSARGAAGGAAFGPAPGGAGARRELPPRQLAPGSLPAPGSSWRPLAAATQGCRGSQELQLSTTLAARG